MFKNKLFAAITMTALLLGTVEASFCHTDPAAISNFRATYQDQNVPKLEKLIKTAQASAQQEHNNLTAFSYDVACRLDIMARTSGSQKARDLRDIAFDLSRELMQHKENSTLADEGLKIVQRSMQKMEQYYRTCLACPDQTESLTSKYAWITKLPYGKAIASILGEMAFQGTVILNPERTWLKNIPRGLAFVKALGEKAFNFIIGKDKHREAIDHFLENYIIERCKPRTRLMTPAEEDAYWETAWHVIESSAAEQRSIQPELMRTALLSPGN